MTNMYQEFDFKECFKETTKCYYFTLCLEDLLHNLLSELRKQKLPIQRFSIIIISRTLKINVRGPNHQLVLISFTTKLALRDLLEKGRHKCI